MRFASPCISLRRRFARLSDRSEKLVHQAAVAIVEQMEQRKLMAVTAVLNNGALTVGGTNGDDVLAVSTKDSGATIAVYSGTVQVAGFPASSVNTIVVWASDGNDTVTSTPSKPTTLNGDAGNDTITGSAGNDTIKGGDGNDSLTGALGNDDIEGGNGDDTLDGSAGNDTVQGNFGADLLSGGTGTDTVDYSDRSTVSYLNPGVTITIDDVFDDGAANEGDDVALNIENVLGTAANDTITASGYNNYIDGGLAGSDSIYGTGGNDTILGGVGWDLLDGGSGNDVLDGGNNSDTVSGQGGDDLMTETEDPLAQGDNVLSGGSGNDTISGANHHDVIDGNSGDDILNGNGGNDTMTGGSGSDSINAGSGDDYINAVFDGAYTDTISGGDGYFDEAHADSALDVYTTGDIETMVWDA